jgi:predicted dehydrogenase
MQRIVIVGYGFMGKMHASVYRLLRNASVAAVVDSRQAVVEKALSEEGHKTPVYASLSEALRQESPDAVDICLPTDLHRVLALEAIRAGKHVFCEKPIALTLADARRMTEAAAKARVRLMIGHCIRFWPEYQALVNFTRKGTAGRLRSLSLQRRAGRPQYSIGNWVNNRARCLGAALDLHIHDTDFVLHYLGQPSGVFSRGIQDDTGWSYIATQYLFDKVVVSAEGGWNNPPNWGFQMAFHAVFEKGTVDYDCRANPSLTFTPANGKPGPLPFRRATTSQAKGGGNISDLGGYYNELDYFIGCLEKGTAIQISTGEHATASLRTTLAEIKSAATGRLTRIP